MEESQIPRMDTPGKEPTAMIGKELMEIMIDLAGDQLTITAYGKVTNKTFIRHLPKSTRRIAPVEESLGSN